MCRDTASIHSKERTVQSVLAGPVGQSPCRGCCPNSCMHWGLYIILYFQLNLENAEFLLFSERMWLGWPIAHLTPLSA